MDNNLCLVLFECCRVVKGSKNSIICDIQRNSLQFLPVEFSNLLLKFNKKPIQQVLNYYPREIHEIILTNLGFLEKEEFIFFTSNPEFFPQLSLEWDEASIISNAIIDLSVRNIDEILKESFWNQIIDITCEHLQIRCFDIIRLNKILNILNKIKSKKIISIDLILKFDLANKYEDYIELINKCPRIQLLTLHSAPNDEDLSIMSNSNCIFSQTSRVLFSSSNCGNIATDFFVLNIKSFTESLHHNSCLNRKISVDAEGNIKNCPSMSESFGNIRDNTLAEAIEKPGFKKYWDINKDKIHVCKDCEYRYICTDCRAYVEDPEDILSKPLKCGYNPYTGEWSEWSTNPLKQKAIDFYGMRDMVNAMNSEEKKD